MTVQVPTSTKKIQEYLGKTRGEVVLWYLFSYTPQHNPIKVVWRKIIRAIAGRYFDKFEDMHKIRNLIKSGSCNCQIWCMLDAIGKGKILQKVTS